MSSIPVRPGTLADTEHFTFLNPVPPFAELLLRPVNIGTREFARIVLLTEEYPNDARLVEMVRKAGDASAKVPYLLDSHQTPASILETLREVARPHVARLQSLPEPLRSTIHLLLSINAVPRGCEDYTITALLEIEWIQEQMTKVLRALMRGRKLALDFYHQNVAALRQLDRDWPRLRAEKASRWHNDPLPEHARMQYFPAFDAHDRLVSLREACVIVDAPEAQMLKLFVPPVLQRPLPESEPVPATGSADWLIRDVGKVGRHFTRALLSIIKVHLVEEKVTLEAANYERIAREAQEALRDYVNRTS